LAEDGAHEYEVTGGVPQGSVLGPFLWNVLYDGVLRINLPSNVTIVAYADDLVIVVVAKHIDELTFDCNEAIRKVKSWLDTKELKLANQKTEVLLVSKRKIAETITITVDALEIVSQPSLRYLGVELDSKLTFKQHLHKTAVKAAGISGVIQKFMPNHGGPRESKRRLLSTVVTSRILYAAPVWADACKIKAYIKDIKSTYRTCAIRVCAAFRTVSEDAIEVLSKLAPIEAMISEIKKLYQVKQDNGNELTEANRKEERLRTISYWQTKWQNSEKGRWTFQLIPNLELWINRRHGEVNHYLTQILSGHGCFKEYLYKYHHDEDPFCPSCVDINENAEHVFFHCPRYNTIRLNLSAELGEDPSVSNLIPHMCESQTKWDAVNIAAVHIMKDLRRHERIRHTQTDDLTS